MWKPIWKAREHEGIFGIEKGDWENEQKLHFMLEKEENENREEQLLYGSTDKYGIYQLKEKPELDQLRFEGTESLKRMGCYKWIIWKKHLLEL